MVIALGTAEYVQVRTPDKVEIAHLVNHAKGLNRTMAQFAEACQISASTLSRIVNGKITKPLSYDTILKIYENRATKEHEFLLGMLLSANGMRQKEEHENNLSKFSMYARRTQLMNRETTMKNIVVTELFDRGIPVVNATRHRFGMDTNTTALEIFPEKIGDMAVALNDAQPSEAVWAFYWFPQEPESEGDQKTTAQQIVRRVISAVSRLLLVDAWQPEVITGLKTSFVFSSEEVFDRFLITLKDAKLNTEMSAILLDIQAGCVLEEQWLPGITQPKEKSIFDTAKVIPNTATDERYDFFDLLDETH